MRDWYLIYSKPRQERVALENLERQHYHAYLPVVRARRRRRGRYAVVIEPMFPRYLFVHLSEEIDDWGPLRSTIGVVNLVRFGQQAARVPDPLIATLKQREDEEGVQVLPAHHYRPGDRVRIVDGVMAGFEAVFAARSSRERVVLLLEIAGKHARVKVDADHIEPVSG